MHELALSRGILEVVLRHAEGRPVRSVDVRIGALRQASPDSLDFYFGVVASGTPCEDARLELHPVPAALRCRACGREWELDRVDFRCPACGGGADVTRGDELEVESIEVEEAGCIEPV